MGRTERKRGREGGREFRERRKVGIEGRRKGGKKRRVVEGLEVEREERKNGWTAEWREGMWEEVIGRENEREGREGEERTQREKGGRERMDGWREGGRQGGM